MNQSGSVAYRSSLSGAVLLKLRNRGAHNLLHLRCMMNPEVWPVLLRRPLKEAEMSRPKQSCVDDQC